MAVKHKIIRLYPSIFHLDVLLGGTQKELNAALLNLYGFENEEEFGRDWVHTIVSKKDSHFKSQIRIVLVLEKLDLVTVVHEVSHILWHTANVVKYEISYETREWQAVLTEYIFAEVVDKNGYTVIPNDISKKK